MPASGSDPEWLYHGGCHGLIQIVGEAKMIENLCLTLAVGLPFVLPALVLISGGGAACRWLLRKRRHRSRPARGLLVLLAAGPALLWVVGMYWLCALFPILVWLGMGGLPQTDPKEGLLALAVGAMIISVAVFFTWRRQLVTAPLMRSGWAVGRRRVSAAEREEEDGVSQAMRARFARYDPDDPFSAFWNPPWVRWNPDDPASPAYLTHEMIEKVTVQDQSTSI